MSEIPAIWQSLMLVPLLGIGLYVTLWIASRFNDTPAD